MESRHHVPLMNFVADPVAILLPARPSRTLDIAKDRRLSPRFAWWPKAPEHPGGPRR